MQMIRSTFLQLVPLGGDHPVCQVQDNTGRDAGAKAARCASCACSLPMRV
jgi:hypothetical protein